MGEQMFDGMSVSEGMAIIEGWDGVSVDARLFAALGTESPIAEKLLNRLRELLRSKDRQVRFQTARLCCKLGPAVRAIASDLLALRDDEYYLVQYHAIRAITHVGVPWAEAEATLNQLRRSPVEWIRLYVEEVEKLLAN